MLSRSALYLFILVTLATTIPASYAVTASEQKSAQLGWAILTDDLSPKPGSREAAIEAFAELKKLAASGDRSAQWNLAWEYERGSRTVKKKAALSIAWMRKAAEQDYASAQTAIGKRYLLGNGYRQNDSEAMKWFKKAADQDYPEAEYFVAMLLGKGTVIVQNDAESFRWMSRAAEHNYGQAQYSLSLFYSMGKGTQKSPHEALKWAFIAKRNKVDDIDERVRDFSDSPSSEIQAAQSAADAWWLQHGGQS